MTTAVAKRIGRPPGKAKIPDGDAPLDVRLTPEQRVFVVEYIRNGRRLADAYRKAFPDSVTKQPTHAARALIKQHPFVRSEINRRLEQFEHDAGVDRVEYLQMLDKVVRADPTRLFSPGGGILPPGQWPEDVKLLVEAYNSGTVTAAEKITLVSRVDTIFKLLEETRKLPDPAQDKASVNINIGLDFDALTDRLRARGHMIDVTPDAQT